VTIANELLRALAADGVRGPSTKNASLLVADTSRGGRASKQFWVETGHPSLVAAKVSNVKDFLSKDLGSNTTDFGGAAARTSSYANPGRRHCDSHQDAFV